MRTFPKTNALLHKLTDGRRSNAVCLLSKKQSAWVCSVLANERAPYIGDGLDVGEFYISRMGKRFARNDNGSVLHITNNAESLALRQAQADKENDSLDELVETIASMRAAGLYVPIYRIPIYNG